MDTRFPAPEPITEDDLSPEYSDDALALEFTARHKDKLRYVAMLSHDPAKYMTKITAVAPGRECPLWRKFLNEITGGNAELQAFLQRIAGYALTGSIREHALFFFYGTGGNGKGVFLYP